ncbi:MAG TPA: 2-hydroxyacyl-CoA dehydratase family protein [Dehalococcoidia bacterium]|nr:2-hydroxyacyl-CoA dehydratase family protein [Dehalococcoidia bacterium]
MTDKTTAPAKRTLESSAAVTRLIRDHYARVKEDKARGRPVVWSYGLTPREIFVALDVPAITVEHLPIMLASKQIIGRYLDIAEQAGFARDLCPYHTAMLGCVEAETRDAYLERLFAPPDIIIGSNIPCMSESKSFLFAVEKYRVPHYFIDAPLNLGGYDPPERTVKYYAAGLKGLLSFLEQHGLKADMVTLSQVVERSREMSRMWAEVDEYRKISPAPMTAVDGVVSMYLPAYTPGRPDAADILRRLRDEVKTKAQNKVGAAENEKFRLLFLGVPPWYNLGLFNYLEKYGGVFVKAEMEYIMTGQTDINVLDPQRPVESLARKALIDMPCPTYANRIDLMRRAIRDFRIDGIVAANKRGCRNLPAGFRIMKDIAAREFGVPMTIIDLDGLDLREYDDVQVKSRLDAFMETLAAT